MWNLEVFETDKNELPKTKGMESEVICNFPSMQLFVGKSGSGKSNLLVNMCKNNALMGNFFDHIYFISPTGLIDDLPKHLKLPKENIWSDLKQAVIDLEILMDNQAHGIEQTSIKEFAKNNKVLVLCDDCVGDKNFVKSDILLKLAIHGRHNLMSSIICTQSYTKVPRGIRLQAQGLALFPSSHNEIKLIIEDYCPPSYTHQEFAHIVNFATDEPYSFLYINNHCKDIKNRFRKKLGKIIEI